MKSKKMKRESNKNRAAKGKGHNPAIPKFSLIGVRVEFAEQIKFWCATLCLTDQFRGM